MKLLLLLLAMWCGAGGVGFELGPDDVWPQDRYGRDTENRETFKLWWNKTGRAAYEKWEAKNRPTYPVRLKEVDYGRFGVWWNKHGKSKFTKWSTRNE